MYYFLKYKKLIPINTLHFLFQYELNTIDEFAQRIGLTKEELIRKMSVYKDLFLENKPLFKEFYALNEKKEKEDQEKGDKCDPDINDESKIANCIQSFRGAIRLLKALEALQGRTAWNDPDVEAFDAVMRDKVKATTSFIQSRSLKVLSKKVEQEPKEGENQQEK